MKGFAWLDYDLGRAVAAWQDCFERENEDEFGKFARILQEGLSIPLFVDRLSTLTFAHARFRLQFLEQLEGLDLVREVRKDFAQDASLAQFDAKGRSRLLLRWGRLVAAAEVEAYMDRYGAELNDLWRHRAGLLQRQARFQDAVELVRESLDMPELPAVEMKDAELKRLQRTFEVLPSDFVKGSILLGAYRDQQDYESALSVAESMADLLNPPHDAFFWKAECLYQIGDFIESWYAFEEYLDH